jgi:hypothetical protein
MAINIGNNTAFYTSKIRNVSMMRKNYNEDVRWAEFPGSNTHSSSDISSRSSFGVQIINCCINHLYNALISFIATFRPSVNNCPKMRQCTVFFIFL